MIDPTTDRQLSADPATGTPRPDLSEAAAMTGNVSDLEGAGRLEEERSVREASHAPDLPDRAFDRITPQA